jgi:Tfp pilus assembly protein PilO
MSGWPLRRIVADKRLWVVPLALLAVVDLVLLGVVLGPLAARVRGLETRADTAALAAANAQRDLDAARELSTGTQRAAGDVERFYTEILPADQASARRLTFLRLAQVARDAGLDFDRRAFTQAQERDGRLVRVDQTLVVRGRYDALREFLHAVEAGDDFVVVRSITVARADDGSGELEASLGVSTYYRADDGR